MQARTRWVERNGLGLHVTDAGDLDAPVVLLVHGWPDSHRLWRHQVPALVDAGYRVVAHDQRGMGASDVPDAPGGAHVKQATLDALAVLDALGVERAHVVGHDWGAAVAWGLAAYGGPGRVRSLTALAVGHPGTSDPHDVHQRELSWYMLLFQFADVAEHWLADHDWAGLRALTRDHPELEAWVADLSRPGRLTAALAWYRDNLHPRGLLRERPALPAVEVPVLGVAGGDDVLLAPRQMERSGAFCSAGWRYEELPGVGHWIPLDAPDAAARLVLDHLRANS